MGWPDALLDVKVEAWTDGGNRRTRAACACVILLENGKKVRRSELYEGEFTNMVMEYHGVILAMTTAIELGAKEITLNTDNQTVERHLLGEYKVRHPDMLVLYEKCMELADSFEAIYIKWIPREWNMEADKLCRDLMDGKKKAKRSRPGGVVIPPQLPPNPFARS